MTTTDEAQGRLHRLLAYLKADPDNPELLADTIRAGIDAGDLRQARDLADHLRLITPGGFAAEYLAGLVEMHSGLFAEASERYARLLESDDRPETRFNLAWCRAANGDKSAALDILDEATVGSIASAAMLRVQLLHEAGDFDGAFGTGTAALDRFPDHHGLLAAMATLALDLEHADLARDYALRAGENPEALAAIGVLDLRAGNTASARDAFARAIAIHEHNPRAWIGQGLAGLSEQDPQRAARDLDRGAQQFEDHIGSWIAAGWAHYLAGDIDAAAQRFERALALDANFAESHGSLAVIDLARGDQAAARHKASAALRLDRECFSAALTMALLAGDDPARAAAIVERAMTTPLDDSGVTLATYMSGLTRHGG